MKSGTSQKSTQVLEEKAVLAALEQSLAMIEFNIEGEYFGRTSCSPRQWGIRRQNLPENIIGCFARNSLSAVQSMMHFGKI